MSTPAPVSDTAPIDMESRFPPSSQSFPYLWRPPPDPEKPDCPYQAGFTVEIKSHTPPPPFGDPHYGPGIFPERNEVDLKAVTQTELVLAHPQLEHPNTVSSSPAATATLTILETLAVADGRGAQLVVCSVTPNPCPENPDGFVAKIFDPLYYSFECPHAAHEADDVSWMADVDYTHEAAALDHLEGMRKAGRMGLAAPKYYGSWTFSLPITHAGVEVQRSVRLVLMENIKGSSIRSVCLDSALFPRYSEADRLEILAMVLDGSVRQRHAGVDQRDLASRNVILRPPPTSSPSGPDKQPLPQPIIIDYNGAVVFELSRNGKHPCQLVKLPQNPMRVFWNSGFPEFEGWTPPMWQFSPRLGQQWMKERFGGEAVASQYEPVRDNLEFSASYYGPVNHESEYPDTAPTDIDAPAPAPDPAPAPERTATPPPAAATGPAEAAAAAAAATATDGGAKRKKGAYKELAPPPTLPPGFKVRWPIPLGTAPPAPESP